MAEAALPFEPSPWTPGVEDGVIAQALLAPVGGLSHLIALFMLGLAAARLRRSWPWSLPALLALSMLPGLLFGHAVPQLHALADGGVLAASGMTGLLLALPRPLAAPVAVTAALLLGLWHGHAGGAAVLQGPAAALVFVLLSAAFYAIGAACGALTLRRRRVGFKRNSDDRRCNRGATRPVRNEGLPLRYRSAPMTSLLQTHRPWYRRLVEDLRAHWQRQRTLQTLRGLDARTLADIGLDASELSSIDSEAHGHGLITRRRIVRSPQHA